MRKTPMDIEYDECLRFSGKGHFYLDSYELFASLESSEIEIESNILLAFNIDGIEIISYVNSLDMSLSLKNQFKSSAPMIGFSVINPQSGLLTPIWELDETIRHRIELFFEEYLVSMRHFSEETITNLDLSINEYIDEINIEGFLKETTGLLEKHGFNLSFLFN